MKSIIPLLLLAFLFSCEEGAPLPCNDGEPCRLCGVSDPETNLAWFKTLTEEINASWVGAYYGFILQGNYVTNVGQGSYLEIPVFIVHYCCPNCSYAPAVYDCDGDFIGYQGDEALDGFITTNGVIWKSSQNGCNF